MCCVKLWKARYEYLGCSVFDEEHRLRSYETSPVELTEYEYQRFVESHVCFFKARSQNCEKCILASSWPSVRPSICIEQLRFHCTDFHGIWYLSIFRKSVEKIQVPLKSDNNNRHFTWRPIHILIISRSVLLRMRNVSDRSCRENQNAHFVFSNFFFFFFFSKFVPFVR